MKIATKNAAIVLNFDLDAIVRWSDDITTAAAQRGPGYLKEIRTAARQIRSFARSLAISHAGAVDLIPGATSLADEQADAEAVVAYVVKRNTR